ncbi:hypothetical protein M378DRAFT_82677, partial [Amanita muscaria Koide BX008]
MPECFRDRYKKDNFFAKIVGQPETFNDFRVHDGLIYKRSGDVEVLCVPDIMLGERRAREIIISHAHSLLAHLGYKKTLQLLREEVWW